MSIVFPDSPWIGIRHAKLSNKTTVLRCESFSLKLPGKRTQNLCPAKAAKLWYHGNWRCARGWLAQLHFSCPFQCWAGKANKSPVNWTQYKQRQNFNKLKEHGHTLLLYIWFTLFQFVFLHRFVCSLLAGQPLSQFPAHTFHTESITYPFFLRETSLWPFGDGGLESWRF